MRISAKARYGLSCMTWLAQNHTAGDMVTVVSLADKLKISKIYLEQVFSLLKRAELVTSTKGSQGGYQLAAPPEETSVYVILRALDSALFEKTDDTVTQGSEYIERAMRELVFDKLDRDVEQSLANLSLGDLAAEAMRREAGEYMYYL